MSSSKTLPEDCLRVLAAIRSLQLDGRPALDCDSVRAAYQECDGRERPFFSDGQGGRRSIKRPSVRLNPVPVEILAADLAPGFNEQVKRAHGQKPRGRDLDVILDDLEVLGFVKQSVTATIPRGAYMRSDGSAVHYDTQGDTWSVELRIPRSDRKQGWAAIPPMYASKLCDLQAYSVLPDGAAALASVTESSKTEGLPRLTEKAARVYEILKALPPEKAMTAPAICDKYLEKHNEILDDSSLRKNLLPQLKGYGLKHKPRVGYYIESPKG